MPLITFTARGHAILAPAMDPPPYARAVRAAQSLLQRCGVRDAPINVHALAQTLGLALRELVGERDDFCGSLVRSAGKPAIHIHSSLSETRERFTIAHELGHYQLHAGDFVDPGVNVQLQFRSKGASPTYREAEANAFAAELLMPEGLLTPHLIMLRHPIERMLRGLDRHSVASIVELLAHKYAVEPHTMTCRLAHLKLIDVRLLRAVNSM